MDIKGYVRTAVFMGVVFGSGFAMAALVYGLFVLLGELIGHNWMDVDAAYVICILGGIAAVVKYAKEGEFSDV
jgi:hypothetical protein